MTTFRGGKLIGTILMTCVMLVTLVMGESMRSRSEALETLREQRRSAIQPGDANCDGAISVADIEPFVTALTDPRAYRTAFPFCSTLDSVDVNRDGRTDPGDIDSLAFKLGSQARLEELEIGPIDGLTTAWHAAPRVTAVPLFSVIHLRATPDGGVEAQHSGTDGHQGPASDMGPGQGWEPEPLPVRWEGAVPVGDGRQAQIAFHEPGHHRVALWSTLPNGEEQLTAETHLIAAAVSPQQIRGRLVGITTPSFGIEEGASNELTMKYFFKKESIAKMAPLGDSTVSGLPLSYAVSVDRTIVMHFTCEPPGFGPLVEIRLGNEALAMQPTLPLSLAEPGSYSVEAGSPAAVLEPIRIEAYRVEIVNLHNGNVIPKGGPVTFEARTDPPGFEDRVVWLSSTKYGTAQPTLGRGESFTVTFDDTFGPEGWEWLGVRADNFAAGSDSFTTDKIGATIPITDDPKTTVPLLDMPLELLPLSMVLSVSEPVLWNDLLTEAAGAPAASNPFSVFVGLIPGSDGSEDFQIQFDTAHPSYNDLLEYPNLGIASDPSGLYTAVSMLFINQSDVDNIYRYEDVLPSTIAEHKGKSPEGGCCAILATAHSLVRKMGGIVTEADSTIDTDDDGEPDEWKPEFLQKVWDATGDADNNRGLSDGEAEAGHEADWNDSWDIDQVDDNVELYDNANLTCQQIKARCDGLAARLGTNDDVTMRIRGQDGKKGDTWGHRVPVEAAVYKVGPPCSCEITITRTSRQEPGGKTDFMDIPFDPGTAKYKITETGVTNTEFPSSTILKLEYDSFDEDPTNENVKPTDQGDPGSALDC